MKKEYSELLLAFTCSQCNGTFDDSMRQPKTKKCKPCCRLLAASWRVKNRDKTRSYSREWGRRNPENAHKHKLANRYGMTLVDYDALLHKQGGVCAICGKPETRTDRRTGRPQMLSVDHEHLTGNNRGLLCNLCNRGLGLFFDNAETLKSAAIYLERFK